MEGELAAPAEVPADEAAVPAGAGAGAAAGDDDAGDDEGARGAGVCSHPRGTCTPPREPGAPLVGAAASGNPRWPSSGRCRPRTPGTPWGAG